MKKIILIFTLTLICADTFAQISIEGKSDPALDSLFNHRVKSLDEFYARFNGEEFDPNVNPDNPESRENNILTLFDKQWLLETQEKDGNKNMLFSEITTFIKQVCKSKQKLSVDDSLFFAEVKFTVKYLGKDKKIGLILKKENTGNFIYRWSIAGVNGLVENKMLDTAGNNGIRPVDHEMNFVQLRGILNNVSNNLANYRSYDANIEDLRKIR